MANYIVVVTGGIGSGKTAVSDRFAGHGIAVVDADVVARAVVEPGRPALAEIELHFGSTVIADDGTLDRKTLRAQIFENADERTWLERLTHPLINAEVRGLLAKADSTYAIYATPLFARRGHYANRVLIVDAPEDVQVARTAARNGSSQAQARAIVAIQSSREERLKQADDVIVNDKDFTHLDREVHRLHEKYERLAADA